MSAKRLQPGEGGYQALTLTIAGMLLIGPLISEFVQLGSLLPGLFTAVILAAVWSVSHSLVQVASVGALSVITLAGVWFQLTGLPAALTQLSGAACFAVVSLVLARDVFGRRRHISKDVIYGGINIYLTIGLAFALLYRALVTMAPDAIDGLAPNASVDHAFYFSFVTLTTLGYGDITPVSSGARMLAAVEAIIGQLYLAVLLAMLVATHLASKRP
ncbi:MAG: potassium channel family protein [Pseudomonadota bacterium]